MSGIIARIARKVSLRLVRRAALWRLISPLATSRLLYRITLGRWPDLRDPRDMNEKILAMMFGSDTSRWSELADKYGVRHFVADRIGEEALVPLYQVADSADDIDFDSLPQSFVIKTSDGFAHTVAVHDKTKADIAAIRATLRRWMRERLMGEEVHYTRIRRRLVVEKLLVPAGGKELLDYKFFCVDGEPVCCMVCSGRDLATGHCEFQVHALPDWSEITAVVAGCRSSCPVEAPPGLAGMMGYCRELGREFPFVRIDFYDVDGHVYFGEMTFSNCAGRTYYFERWFLDRLGAMIRLPEINIKSRP